MKTQRLALLLTVLALTATPALRAQMADDDREGPIDRLFAMMRAPMAAVRALANNANVTTTVSHPAANTVSVQATIITPSNATVSVSTTTTRTDNGFSATGTITPPNAAMLITVMLDVTRANDLATIVTTFIRGTVTKTNTRTVPVRPPVPPRG